MSIAKRLKLLLAMLLGALVLVGMLGVVQMYQQSRSIHFINTNIVPSLAVIDEIETSFAVLRSTVLRHVLSNTTQDMRKLEEEIKHIRSKIDADLEKYQENLITNDKDRALFADEQARIKEYYSVVDQVLPLSKSFQSARAAEKIYIARPMIDAITQALDNHSDYNLHLTEQEGAIAEAGAKRDGGIILGVLAVTATAALFLGLAAFRQITKSLHAIQTTMVNVASGLDFTQRVTVRNRDEIADTAEAFNALLDKVQGSLKTMCSWAECISVSSSQLALAVQQVSVHSDEQSKAASSMAAAVEELSTNGNSIADRADEINELTTNAGSTAEKGIFAIEQALGDIRLTQSVVAPVVKSVTRLDEDNTRVHTVISMIRSVAELAGQLAKKAASAEISGQSRIMEITDEIHRLTENMVRSTEDIAMTLASIQADADHAIDGTLTAMAHVEKSVTRATTAESAVREIASGSKQTVLMVDEITNAIHQQDLACKIIVRQVEQVAYISEENSIIAQNAAVHSKELNDIASAMRDETAQYRV